MRAKPNFLDSVAAHSRIHATRNDLNLWQFWHRLILGDIRGNDCMPGGKFYSDLRWSLNCLILLASKLTIRHDPRASLT